MVQTSEVSFGLGKVKNLSVFVALAVSSLALEESGVLNRFCMVVGNGFQLAQFLAALEVFSVKKFVWHPG